MTIRDIEHAVVGLPAKKLMTFRAWFHKFDARIWDKKFKQDANAGRLDAVAGKAIADFRKGRCREL